MARAQSPDHDSGISTQSDQCPECGGDVRPDDGAGGSVCADCGLVVDDEPIDRGPEWRAFDSNHKNDRSRVGSPVTENRHDNGLSTTIGHGSTDANGRTLSASQQRRTRRLRRQQKRTIRRSKAERNQTALHCEVNRLVAALDLPEVVAESAGRILGRAREADLFRGGSLNAFAAGAVYAACREHDRPVVPGDVVDYMRDEDQRFWRSYHKLERELGLTTLPFTAAEHVPRLVDAVGLPPETAGVAAEVARAAADHPDTGTPSPSGLAAGVVYHLFGDRSEVTHDKLADAADVTRVTVQQNRDRVVAADLEGDESA